MAGTTAYRRLLTNVENLPGPRGLVGPETDPRRPGPTPRDHGSGPHRAADPNLTMAANKRRLSCDTTPLPQAMSESHPATQVPFPLSPAPGIMDPGSIRAPGAGFPGSWAWIQAAVALWPVSLSDCTVLVVRLGSWDMDRGPSPSLAWSLYRSGRRPHLRHLGLAAHMAMGGGGWWSLSPHGWLLSCPGGGGVGQVCSSRFWYMTSHVWVGGRAVALWCQRLHVAVGCVLSGVIEPKHRGGLPTHRSHPR